jgi:hypothetical protein
MVLVAGWVLEEDLVADWVLEEDLVADWVLGLELLAESLRRHSCKSRNLHYY